MFLRASAPSAGVRDRYGVIPIVTEVCTKLCTKLSSRDFALGDLETLAFLSKSKKTVFLAAAVTSLELLTVLRRSWSSSGRTQTTLAAS
jgi:hypothetical protein